MESATDEKTAPQPAPTYDGWELEEHLRHAQRVVALTDQVAKFDPEETNRARLRLDPAHPDPAGWRTGTLPRRAPRPSVLARGSETFSWNLTWTILSLGLAALVCGGVLLGWSIVSQRQELWTIGVPIGLTGMIALLAGLILQLERLGNENRHTAAKLDLVDRQLHELRSGVNGDNKGRPDAVLFSHRAEEMEPLRLMTDLKNQLEALSRKLDETETGANVDP